MDSIPDRPSRFLPRLVVVAGTGYLAAVWLVILVVDRSISDPSDPLWARLFTEAGPTERLQWTLLFACSAACLWGLRATGAPYRFLALMAYGTILMLVEDSVNLSHIAVYRLGARGDMVGTMSARLAVYGLVAALPVLAFARYWRHLRAGRAALASGFVLYGTAAAMSVPANLFGLYQRIGPWIIQQVGIPSAPPGTFEFPEYDIPDTTGVAFLDLAVEESLELLGATLLLSGLLSVAIDARWRANASIAGGRRTDPS